MKLLRIFFLLAAFSSIGVFSVKAYAPFNSAPQARQATKPPRPSRTATRTPTGRPTLTSTVTRTSTDTPGPTDTPTFTNSLTASASMTLTPTTTSTLPADSPTFTDTPTWTETASFTLTGTLTTSETPTPSPTPAGSTFTFASMGDAQYMVAKYLATSNQIASLNPAFVLYTGDLESNGVVSTEMDAMVTDLKTAGIFDQTFPVRGNHDNHISGSAALWESYFESDPNIRILPAGVTDYVALNSSSDTLTYSFIYGNSMFLGFDVPGAVGLLTAAQYTFMDARLTDAENLGLTHAFIYFHGPMYCVESVHCTCMERTASTCTPNALIAVVNKHPIISAFLHGHEHILGWAHMDNTRLPGLTGSFEEFITSPSGGGTYNAYVYPERLDYYYPDMGRYEYQGFATISVDGASFTFSLYRVGTTAPVWTRTFTKQ